MGSIRDLFSDWANRADQRLVGQVMAAVSADAETTTERLRRSGRPFLDPATEEKPSLAEVEITALHIVRQSRVRVGALVAWPRLRGALSVPPEVLATGIAALRLSQRLAVVYGFDPDTDRGEMAVFQALAAGFEVNLPERGTVGLRVSALPRLLLASVDTDTTSAGGALATSVVKQSVLLVGPSHHPTRACGVLWMGGGGRSRSDGRHWAPHVGGASTSG